MVWTGPLQKIDDYRYMIPQAYKRGMTTSGLVYLSPSMLDAVRKDEALEQVANVAMIPGILGKSLAMPDIHWGYGFPIGGVAAVDAENGVISPGGVGYDINCGVRLVRTNLTMNEIKANLRQLIDTMFHNVPSGVGSEGKIRLTMDQLDDVLENGAEWAVRNGYGWHEDLKHLEENGRIDGADSMVVSHRAKTRGLPQLGSLGAGNHFLEIQRVDEIFDSHVAKVFGITAKDQIVVMIHTGSRGCGYQICEDSIRELEKPYHKEGKEFVSDKFKIRLPDRQLVCAPLNSREAERYIKAMKCAANYAWANRQMITHWVREAFERVLRKSAEELDLAVVYDVAHNIAKLEEHVIEGKRRKVYVHRKGATRAFPGNLSQVPEKYQAVGQPVLIPGDMGTASYILVGTELAMVESWGSTCHGSGRVLSRHEAIRRFRDRGIKEELLAQGIYVRAASAKVLSEEAPAAYKDVDAVVEACHGAGISRKIARMKPLGVVKG